MIEINARTETREENSGADHAKIKDGFPFPAYSYRRYEERGYDYLGVDRRHDGYGG
jgi:hypothetical protein